MVSIKEEIIPNSPFHYSGPLLVILSVSSNMDFGDTREVSLSGPYRMLSEDRKECVLTIEMNVYSQ